MTNLMIARIFVWLSALLLITAVLVHAPIMSVWASINLILSYLLYRKQS